MLAQVITTDTVLDDLVGRLAAPLQRKLERLEEQREAARAAQGAAFDAWQDARRELAVAQADATAAAESDRRNPERMTQHRWTGQASPPSDRVTATAAVLARRQNREASRLRARDEAEAAWNVAHQVLDGIRRALRHTDPMTLLPIVLAASPHRTPQDAPADLARLRASIATVTGELRTIERAPGPLAEAAVRFDAFIDAAAKAYDPSMAASCTPSIAR